MINFEVDAESPQRNSRFLVTREQKCVNQIKPGVLLCLFVAFCINFDVFHVELIFVALADWKTR